jgi:hypothetical protein
VRLAFDGGDLEAAYNAVNGEHDDSVAAAKEIRDRVDSVESVANVLFGEWQTELAEYAMRRSAVTANANYVPSRPARSGCMGERCQPPAGTDHRPSNHAAQIP